MALFLPDLLQMYAQRGGRIIDAETAFQDPLFACEPDILPAGASILWAMAKQSGRFADVLLEKCTSRMYWTERFGFGCDKTATHRFPVV